MRVIVCFVISALLTLGICVVAHKIHMRPEKDRIVHYHTKENGCVKVYNRGGGHIEVRADRIPANSSLKIEVPRDAVFPSQTENNEGLIKL